MAVLDQVVYERGSVFSARISNLPDGLYAGRIGDEPMIVMKHGEVVWAHDALKYSNPWPPRRLEGTEVLRDLGQIVDREVLCPDDLRRPHG